MSHTHRLLPRSPRTLAHRATVAALAATFATALLLLTGCKDDPAPLPPEPEAPTLQGRQLRFAPGHPQLAQLGITAATPARSVTVELPSRLVWNESVTQRIYPAFAGRVTAIVADVGDSVRPGSVLARVASPDFGQAQADTARARADVELTQRALQRARELFEAGIVARKDLEQTEAEAVRARAEGDRAAARTRLYGSASGVDQQMALVASLAGVVVERNINPSQELRPDGGGAPLFVISDPTSLWVQIDARESEAGTLRPGATFELSVPSLDGERFEGRVVAASDAIDPASRTIHVRGVVANPARRLKAEMLATARFERMLGAGVMVPASAVVLRGTGHVVYVQSAPGTFEAREVKLGYTGSKDVLVTRGLEAGDEVVSENTLLLARQFGNAEPGSTATATASTDKAGAGKP